MKNYETVFILNPVLSEDQAKDTVEKFVKVLKKAKAEIVGFYALLEFAAAPETVNTLETEFRRDESVMRFLTTVLDKHSLAYNARRRKGEFNRGKKTSTTKRAEEGKEA